MNTKTALMTLAIAASFAGMANAQDATSTTTTTDTTIVTTTPVAPPAVTPEVAVAAKSPMAELDVRAALAAQGYTAIEDVKFADGTWTAEAKSADGNKVDLHIDAETGKVIPDEAVATVNKDAIIATLLAAKYTDVHRVKFEDGVWTADAKDSSGSEVDVKLDPNDGHILGSTNEEADKK